MQNPHVSRARGGRPTPIPVPFIPSEKVGLGLEGPVIPSDSDEVVLGALERNPKVSEPAVRCGAYRL